MLLSLIFGSSLMKLFLIISELSLFDRESDCKILFIPNKFFIESLSEKVLLAESRIEFVEVLVVSILL